MKIAVLGARGYLGSQVMQGLDASARIHGLPASRRGGPLSIDLTQPETFSRLEACDGVVNCSDSVAVPPDDLARWCLESGKLFVETSSDRITVERLLHTHRNTPQPGGLLLGAGIFTGLSNVLAGNAAQAHDGTRHLDLGIRFSPIAKGGQGMVNLIAHLLDIETLSIQEGKPHLGPPIAKGPTLPFGDKRKGSLLLPLAEPAMLFASTGVPNISAAMSPTPGWLRPLFTLPPVWLMRWRPMRAMVRFNMMLLRRVFFAWRKSPVVLSAWTRTDLEDPGRVSTLSVSDGMLAGGFAVAAMLERIARSGELPTGAVLPDELFETTHLVEDIQRLSGDTLAVQLQHGILT